MIVLGVDPGSRRVGFGIIENIGGKTKLVHAELLDIKSGKDSDALLKIKNKLSSLIKSFSPHLVAVEGLFFSKNKKTAIAVAQARGVILLVCKEMGVRVVEYSPTKIKMMITGNGNADKKAVSKMVGLTLGSSSLDFIDDVSDAIAVAITASSDKSLTY